MPPSPAHELCSCYPAWLHLSLHLHGLGTSETECLKILRIIVSYRRVTALKDYFSAKILKSLHIKCFKNVHEKCIIGRNMQGFHKIFAAKSHLSFHFLFQVPSQMKSCTIFLTTGHWIICKTVAASSMKAPAKPGFLWFYSALGWRQPGQLSHTPPSCTLTGSRVRAQGTQPTRLRYPPSPGSGQASLRTQCLWGGQQLGTWWKADPQ